LNDTICENNYIKYNRRIR